MRLMTITALAALSMGMAGPALAQSGEAAATPPPASAFAREAAIASVDISPDGQHVAAVISPDGDRRLVSLWKSDALDQAPYIIGSDDERAEVVGVSFVKNDRIFVTTQQLTSFNPFSGRQERSYITRRQILDLEGNPVRLGLEFDGLTDDQQALIGVGSLVSSLPQDDESILVKDPVKGDIYKLNVYNGRASRVYRGSSEFSGEQADLDGDIRARTQFEFDDGAVYIAQWIKHPDTGDWAEHFRWYARDRAPVEIVGFSNDPNIIFVSRVGDRDRAAIWEYDIRAREFTEIAFAHPLFEAAGVIRSRAPENFGEVIGFGYNGPRSQTYYTDPVLEASQKQLRDALKIDMVPVEWTDIASGEQSTFTVGETGDVSIVASSLDRGEMIVAKDGLGTPTEYYILANGKLRLLGRAYPELKDAALGDGEVIQYKARDGLMVPAILTKPDPAVHGTGPYPMIVVPHGGPWGRDGLGWDRTGWVQYFATRGYAVVQPQFRGSQGWGQRLWRAGDGEWGRQMQDDLDDAVIHLVAQGVADPERVAVHGYSYGGYAAMMAAVRPNGLYQCAVAGAGPASIALFKKGTYNSRFLREFQHPTAEGEDPIARVNEVSIPLYLYTGDRDTNVLPSESETMAAALERAGKPVQLRILPDMEHTLNTWTPENMEAVLTSVEDFFKTQCGPGGL